VTGEKQALAPPAPTPIRLTAQTGEEVVEVRKEVIQKVRLVSAPRCCAYRGTATHRRKTIGLAVTEKEQALAFSTPTPVRLTPSREWYLVNPALEIDVPATGGTTSWRVEKQPFTSGAPPPPILNVFDCRTHGKHLLIEITDYRNQCASDCQYVK